VQGCKHHWWRAGFLFARQDREQQSCTNGCVILGLPFPLVNLARIWQDFSAAFTHTIVVVHIIGILFVGSFLQRHCGNTF